jgi:hypothetical protein
MENRIFTLWDQYTPLQLHCEGYNELTWGLEILPYLRLMNSCDITEVRVDTEPNDCSSSSTSYSLLSEERRILFFFDDFHFCRSRVIGLDMTENRIFTLCRMITWVVFLRMFWNFIGNTFNKCFVILHKLIYCQ